MISMFKQGPIFLLRNKRLFEIIEVEITRVDYNYCNHPQSEIVWFYSAMMYPEDTDRIANSIDLDQTAF